MQRRLWELCAQLTDGTVERRSPWISDEWLAKELAENPRLDRLVDIPEEYVRDGVTHPLPYE